MSLTIITRNEIGGVLTYVLNFSFYLKSNNIKHTLLLYQESQRLYDFVNIEANTINVYFSKFGSKISKFKFFKKFIDQDVTLILNDTFECEFINFFKLRNKCIYILHGDIMHYRGYLEKYYKSFDDVFCVSEGLKKIYQPQYPCHSFQIAHPMIKDYPIKSNFTINKPLKIISIGRFEYLKGSDTIRSTIDYLIYKSIKFEWTLFIPPSRNEEQLLLEIRDKVIIKRGLKNSQVLNEIEDTDILFFPSRSEGFGMSVIECLKRGVVVVARDIPVGIPEMVFNNVNGLICSNDEEFQLSIETLINNPKMFVQMKLNANQISNKMFGFNSECKKLFESISNCVINKDKIFIDVKNEDPIMPETTLRIGRYLKQKLL